MSGRASSCGLLSDSNLLRKLVGIWLSTLHVSDSMVYIIVLHKHSTMPFDFRQIGVKYNVSQQYIVPSFPVYST